MASPDSLIPAMLRAGVGSIVNISSILGRVGFANAAAYTAVKHGVVGLTETAALEYSSQNLRTWWDRLLSRLP